MLATAKPTTPPRHPNPDPALRLKEAADYLDVHVKTVRRLIAEEKIKTVHLTASIKGVRRSELERFLTEGPAKPAKAAAPAAA